jgi:rare lipoprotein A
VLLFKGFGKFRLRRRVGGVVLFVGLIAASLGWDQGSLVSWYSLPGSYTASGDLLTEEDWTAAHKTLPFGTIVKVCYVDGCARGVEITDRGPYIKGRDLDVNLIVADRIGLTAAGVDYVYWDVTCYACGDGYR